MISHRLKNGFSPHNLYRRQQLYLWNQEFKLSRNYLKLKASKKYFMNIDRDKLMSRKVPTKLIYVLFIKNKIGKVSHAMHGMHDHESWPFYTVSYWITIIISQKIMRYQIFFIISENIEKSDGTFSDINFFALMVRINKGVSVCVKRFLKIRGYTDRPRKIDRWLSRGSTKIVSHTRGPKEWNWSSAAVPFTLFDDGIRNYDSFMSTRGTREQNKFHPLSPYVFIIYP